MLLTIVKCFRLFIDKMMRIRTLRIDRNIRVCTVQNTGQTSHRQEQQGEDQTHDHSWIGWAQPWNGRISHLVQMLNVQKAHSLC